MIVRVDHDEKTTHGSVMRGFDCACPVHAKRSRRKRSRRAHHAQPHRVTHLRDDRCCFLVPGSNHPTAPISQGEVVLQSLRQ